jgi:hypothetical protein
MSWYEISFSRCGVFVLKYFAISPSILVAVQCGASGDIANRRNSSQWPGNVLADGLCHSATP